MLAQSMMETLAGDKSLQKFELERVNYITQLKEAALSQKESGGCSSI